MTQPVSIRKLVDYLLLNACSVNSSGLYSGKAGMALALFEAGRYLQDENIDNQAFDLFQEALVTKNEDIGFENGLAGVGYILLYLTENGFVNADFNEIFNDQCEKIIEGFQDIDKMPDRLLISSKVIYFFAELNRTKNEDTRIKSIIEKIFQGIELYLSMQFFDWNNLLYINSKSDVLKMYETYLQLVDYSGYKYFSRSLLDSYAELYRNNRIASSLPIGYYLRNIVAKNNPAGYEDVINNNINNGLKSIYPPSLNLSELFSIAKVLARVCNSCLDKGAQIAIAKSTESNLRQQEEIEKEIVKRNSLHFALPDAVRYLAFCANKNAPIW